MATGVGHTVRDFLTATFARVGITEWAPYVEIDPSLLRPNDTAALVGDASLARRELGWEPTVGFEELVARMVDAELDRAHGRPPHM